MMRFNFRTYNSFENVLSACYIAKRTGLETDKYGNSIPVYGQANAKPYMWNIQPVKVDSDINSFGEEIIDMRVAMLVGEEAKKYKNYFKEYDVAYLDGASPADEVVNGSNANYEIYAVRPQNVALLIYFKKII